MGKHVKKVFRKKSLKPNTACQKNTSWYTDADGFLEHSSSRGSLYYKGPAFQKTIPFLGGIPPCTNRHKAKSMNKRLSSVEKLDLVYVDV